MANDAQLAGFLRQIYSRLPTIGGKKAFQKLLYLAQVNRFPTNYRFRLHFYGPYSDEAAAALEVLRDAGAVTVDQNGALRQGGYLAELAQEAGLSAAARGIAQSTAANLGGETALQLELLATTHFMWEHERRSSAHPTDVAVIHRVRRYKADKFTDTEIQQALDRLRELELIH